MKIFQYSCVEDKKPDFRQAEAVIKKRPDVIFFEAPTPLGKPSLNYNKFSTKNKPLSDLKKHYKMLKEVSKKYPWVISDIQTYKNIEKLWKEGHDVKLYSIDAPSELLKIGINLNNDIKPPKPKRRGTNFNWWVRIYLRERIMSNYMMKILPKYKKENTALVFLQSFHWRNVKFLLSKPSKQQIYKYYFGSFKSLNLGNLNEHVLETNNPILTKYWKKVSDFS